MDGAGRAVREPELMEDTCGELKMDVLVLTACELEEETDRLTFDWIFSCGNRLDHPLATLGGG